MAADFVPFLSSVRSKLKAPGAATAGFAPVTTSAASMGGGAAPVRSAVETGCSGPAAHGRDEVKVELKRSGERITQIRIECRCGEVIELDCEY